MTFDWDDLAADEPGHRCLQLLDELRLLNPLFRCTLFAIPARCNAEFLTTIPRWVELAVHGWDHHSVYECANWTRERTQSVLSDWVVRAFFVNGFKAPGWQISNNAYTELEASGWWVADQHLEDKRRPPGLRTYLYEDGNWHGHVTDVCGNGINETWEHVQALVAECDEFRFASESAR